MTAPNPRGTDLLIFTWVLTAFAVLVVALRVLAKMKIRKFRMDDVMMILALILDIIQAALNTAAVKHGYGLPDKSVSESHAKLARKFFIIGQAFVVSSVAVCRAAFVLYLLAILGGKKWQRIILTTLAVLGLVLNLGGIVILFNSCKPVSMLWDFTVNGRCAPTYLKVIIGFFPSVFNIFVDLYLAVVPTYIFWQLNLKLGIRISLVLLMSGGLLAMVAALIKTIQIPEINNELLSGTMKLNRLGTLEANLVIITASLPCLRSFVLSGFNHMTGSKERSRSLAFELGAALSGTGAATTSSVTANKTPHRKTDSRFRGILSTIAHGDDGASVDGILGSRNSLDGNETRGGSHDVEAGFTGIRKQVEVTVVAHDHSQNDKGGV